MENKTKIKNIILAAMFAFALLVPGATIQSANASTGSGVNVDGLINDMIATQNEILKLDSVNDAQKIQALNDKFWMLNDLINIMTYVEPTRYFVAEWVTLEEKQDKLENTLETLSGLGVSGTVDQVIDNHISQIDVNIENLRQESINSMVLDTRVENNLERTQNKIHQEYSHIADSYIDSEQQKVIVLVDYTVTSNGKPTLEMLQKLGINDVSVINTPQLTSCSGIKDACNPAVGGLAIVRSDESDSRGYSGSVGYKARDSSGHTGFVTAGHVADWSTNSPSGSSNTIINYYDSTTLGGTVKLGDVTEAYGTQSSARSDGKKHLDVAFVKTNKISDDIYLRANKVVDITAYASSNSDHQIGDLITMIGATSGTFDYGKIQGLAFTSGIIVMKNINALPGDSGGPIFKSTIDHGVRNTTLMGHVITSSQYVPANLVKSYYGITPLTR